MAGSIMLAAGTAPLRVSSAAAVAGGQGRRCTASSFARRIAGVLRSAPPLHGLNAKGAAVSVSRRALHRGLTASVVAASGNGSEEYDYDLFCIGAGSGGVRASRMSSAMGAKAAVCEMPFNAVSSDTEGGVGGTCVLRGCVPKKLYVYGSEYTEAFKDSSGFGWSGVPASPELNWPKMLEAKTNEITRLTGIYKNILKNAGVELIEGRGKLVDAHTVDVDGKKYTAKNICIAVGGKPHLVGVPGSEYCITSDEALTLEKFPKKVCVIGGGYIACEFAGIFKGYGSETHLIYRQPLPLRGFDGECRTFLAEQMEQKGIIIHSGSTPTEIVKNDDGTFTLKCQSADGNMFEQECDVVMMATGRKPKTANLGLESVGVEMNSNGAIIVDEYSQTNVPNIYAIGDVTDRVNLTPVALMEGMALAKTLFEGTPTVPDHTNIASAVFTQPPLATVGLTEEEAIEQLGDIDVYTSAFRPMKNTISGNPGRAFMKLVVDANTDKVVGVHMVGPDAAEIMQGMGVAVKIGVTKKQLDTVVGIHPSSAEEFVTMRTVTRQIRNKELVNK